MVAIVRVVSIDSWIWLARGKLFIRKFDAILNNKIMPFFHENIQAFDQAIRDKQLISIYNNSIYISILEFIFQDDYIKI